MNYSNGLVQINSALMAPSAALVSVAARSAQQQQELSNTYDLPSYPIVYGSDVWVHRPIVISERWIGEEIERIQILSLGEIGEVELQAYNDCCQPIGAILPTNLRLGAQKQDRLTDAFYIPCGSGCCECPGSGDPIVYSDRGDRLEITLDTTSLDPPGTYAWTIYLDDVASGTVWADTSGAFNFSALVPVSVNMRLEPTTTAASTPVFKLTSGGPVTTVGVYQGAIAAAPIAGATTGLLPLDPAFIGVRSDIDGSLSGLAAVKTLTRCDYPPSFKVKKGRVIRNIVAAETVGEEGRLDKALIPATATTIENLSTGISKPIADVDSLEVDVGDTWAAFFKGESNYMPDIWLDLASNPWGGLNDIYRPRYFADYEALRKTRDYCVATGTTFGGSIRRQSFSQLTQQIAIQSGCIVTRRGNRTGFTPDNPDDKPKILFTGSNANDFQYIWETWDAHATNRLIIHWSDPRKCNKATLVCEDASLDPARNSYIETQLNWEFVNNAAQAERLAIQSFNSIRYQRFSCYLRSAIIDHKLDAGDVIAVTSPSWEVQAEFSGAIADIKGDVITPTWEPVISSGPGYILDGQTLEDSRQDFTKLVSVGDVVAIGDLRAKITQVLPTKLITDKILPPAQSYKVLDLTLEGLSWMAYDPRTGRCWTPTEGITAILDAKGGVGYQVSGPPPPIGAAFAIAKRFQYYRVADIDPIDNLDLALRGTAWFPGHDKAINTRIVN